MSKTLFITQLQKGQLIEGELFGLNAVKRSQDRNNKPYLDLELVDNTGSIKAKVWSDKIEQIENAALKEGNIVKVNGVVGEFNGTPQLTVHSLTKSEETNLADYINSSKNNIDEMWEKLEDTVDDIGNERIKNLLTKLLELHEEEIRKSPAAKSIHHNFVGGLLEHILEMTDISQSVLKLYPEADKNLVVAGIILHDIGKIFELKVDGFQIDYTKEGRLVGHIVLGIKLLNELNTKILHQEELLHLEHMILSHHFILEFGSPVTPVTIEAMIVSKLDDLSSKVRIVQKVLKNNIDNQGEFAAREFGIEGQIYLGAREDTRDS